VAHEATQPRTWWNSKPHYHLRLSTGGPVSWDPVRRANQYANKRRRTTTRRREHSERADDEPTTDAANVSAIHDHPLAGQLLGTVKDTSMQTRRWEVLRLSNTFRCIALPWNDVTPMSTTYNMYNLGIRGFGRFVFSTKWTVSLPDIRSSWNLFSFFRILTYSIVTNRYRNR